MEGKIIAKNRAAKHEYNIIETYETGIVLKGTEVKSIRKGKVNLKDSFAYVKDGEVFVANLHISPYEQGNIYNTDPLRLKKLLLNKREIRKLKEAVQKDGFTLVPLDLHFDRSFVKVSLAVAKGKKLYDKRESDAKDDAKRKIDQALKRNNR